jgi:hypothetical protein
LQCLEEPIADQNGAGEDDARDNVAPTATRRRAVRGSLSVTARKVGVSPIGSTTTNKVRKAEMA